jgi:hypothetical protein
MRTLHGRTAIFHHNSDYSGTIAVTPLPDGPRTAHTFADIEQWMHAYDRGDNPAPLPGLETVDPLDLAELVSGRDMTEVVGLAEQLDPHVAGDRELLRQVRALLQSRPASGSAPLEASAAGSVVVSGSWQVG